MATKQKNEFDAFVGEFVDLIKSGSFDGHLDTIDAAITARIAEHNAPKAKSSGTATKRSAEKKVPAPVRSAIGAAAVALAVGKTYVVSDKVKNIGGKKVKFLRYRKDDDKKAVVEMLEDASGAPKGKKIVVPVAALKKPVAVGRRVKKGSK